MRKMFCFENEWVTVLIDEDGDCWWIAQEVCSLLGFSSASDALRGLEDDEKQVIKISTHNMRGNPAKNIINESGLYSLIFKSRKPAAKRFKRWVTSVVLPEIRRTGSYGEPKAKSIHEFADPIKAAEEFIRYQKELRALEAQRNQAIREKGQISRKREAKVMGLYSGKVRENEKLKWELGINKNCKQVKAMYPELLDYFDLDGRDSNRIYIAIGKMMSKLSRRMGIDIEEVADVKYKTVKAYYNEVWDEFFDRLEDDLNFMCRYRRLY
jgi:prophage antirepressor-like protein